MKIEIYATYRSEKPRWRTVSINTETNLTIPQLRRLHRVRNLSTSAGLVSLSAGSWDDDKHARHAVEQGRLTVLFADKTGLIPSDAGRRTWRLRHTSIGTMRAFDHDLVWRTPSGAIVYTSEPYDTEGVAPWMAHTGWQYLLLPPEHSMYGHGTYLLIATADTAVDVAAIADAWVAR